jgi:hypothetical protein
MSSTTAAARTCILGPLAARLLAKAHSCCCACALLLALCWLLLALQLIVGRRWAIVLQQQQ